MTKLTVAECRRRKHYKVDFNDMTNDHYVHVWAMRESVNSFPPIGKPVYLVDVTEDMACYGIVKKHVDLGFQVKPLDWAGDTIYS